MVSGCERCERARGVCEMAVGIWKGENGRDYGNEGAEEGESMWVMMND